MLWRYYGGWW